MAEIARFSAELTPRKQSSSTRFKSNDYDHLVEEQLEALYLHLGAREAVEQRAILLLRLKQLAQQDADYVPVPDHAAARLDGARLRSVKELGNHNGWRLDVAHVANEVRVGAFASTPWGNASGGGRAPSRWHDGTEDELRILDFQLRGVS